MSAIKNPSGSFYLEDEDFEIKRKQTPTGKHPVVCLKDIPFEIPDLSDKYISTNLKGQPNGVAELDEAGRLLSSQLPSGIDKAEEYGTKDEFPEAGQANIVYVDLSTNLEYRWSGTTYVQIPTGLALGNTAKTAFRGDHGEAAYLATVNGHPVRDNPVLTAQDVKAEPVGNLDKPIHTTMVVTASVHGQGFKADYSSSEIINHAQTGVVILKYDDPDTGRSQSYPFSFANRNREAVFIRNFIVEDEHKVKRYDIVIDYNENVRVEEHSLSTIDLDIPNAQVGYTIEVAKVQDGRVTQWKITPLVKIDDVNLSVKTTMSSFEMAKRLSCTKRAKGQSVTMYPVEGYPLDITAEIHALQNGDGEPSTANEKPISGWANVVVSIDNTQLDGRKDYNQQFNETIYGGTYEPNRGRLKVTMGYKLFNGSEAWEKIDRTINGRKPIFKLNVPGLGASDNTMTQMCNIFKTGPVLEPFNSDCVWAVGDDIYVGNGIVEKFSSDLAQFKTQLGRTNMQLVYELAQPRIEVVEQKRIVAIEGKNIISASTGDVNVSTQSVGCIEEEVQDVVRGYLQTPEGVELIKAIVNNQV